MKSTIVDFNRALYTDIKGTNINDKRETN